MLGWVIQMAVETGTIPETQKKVNHEMANPLNFLVGARGFSGYVTHIMWAPASAPLHSLPQPSLAAFATFSRRSFCFESSLHTDTKKAPTMWPTLIFVLVGARGFEPPTSWSQKIKCLR